MPPYRVCKMRNIVMDVVRCVVFEGVETFVTG
jgi:hypothetical protein